MSRPPHRTRLPGSSAGPLAAPRRGGLTVRVARWSATHPWRAIGAWLLLVVAALALSSVVTTRQMVPSDVQVGESGRAYALLSGAGLIDPPVETVLITSRSGATDRALAERAAAELRAGLAPLPSVQTVSDPVWIPDAHALVLPISLRGSPDDGADRVQPLLDVTAQVQTSYPGLRVEQAGAASLSKALNDHVGRSLGEAERLSLPITFAILLIAFGALVAAGIPVLLAITSVLVTLGIYAPVSHLLPDSGSVANIVLLIGMAVGVDYSLLYLRRERDERRGGARTLDAIETAAATAGRAVVVSGFAVMVSMAGLFLSLDAVFSALATGSILVVAVAVLGSLTVLPALLAVAGRWVDRPRVPLLHRVTDRMVPGAISGRLLRPVLRHAKIATVVSGVALIAVAVPALGMRLGESSIETLPRDIPRVQTFLHLQQVLPASRPTFDVVLRAEPAAIGPALRSVAERARAAGVTDVAPGDVRLRVSSDGRTGVAVLPAPGPDGDKANERALDRLRTQVVPAALGGTHATWAVGGEVAETVDWTQHQRQRLPWVVGFVLGLTFLMVGWAFRSVVLALVTTVLNLLSVGAAFGMLVLVFQHGWADALLGMDSPGMLVSWIPLFCFVVLVGLSMDYHVFVLSRIREARQAGLAHRQAVEQEVRSTAGVVGSAAAVMISVFAVFAAADLTEMKQLGVGLAVAIAVDATVVRLVLLPALLLLLERRLTGLGRGGPRPDTALGQAPAVDLVRA